jgi:hypothetical protein
VADPEETSAVPAGAPVVPAEPEQPSAQDAGDHDRTEPREEHEPAEPAIRLEQTARRLPPYRPHRSPAASAPAVSAPAAATAVAEPLRLTLSEAIALVQEGGGDAIELHFLRRELERRSREGHEPEDLWPRIEHKVSTRLQRVGRLAEGQTLTLERDP